MKTIKERVNEIMEYLTSRCTPFTLEKPYMLIKTALTDIATEQKSKDIKKACEWIDEYFPTRGNGETTFISIEAVKECFRKAMEE